MVIPLLQAVSSAVFCICGASHGPSASAELLVPITSLNASQFSKFFHW